jgi:hypothetical protein
MRRQRRGLVIVAALIASASTAHAQRPPLPPVPTPLPSPSPSPLPSPSPSPPLPSPSPSPSPGVDLELAALRAEIAALRVRVEASDRRPALDPTATPVRHDDDRFSFTTADGRYRLDFDAYTQVRHSTIIRRGDFVDGGFQVRRLRWISSGALGEQLSFLTMIDLAQSPFLLEAYGDWKLFSWLTVRVGRDKTPFTRSFLTPGDELAFPDRPHFVDGLRWGRDLGVQVRMHGRRIAGQVGFTNGAIDGATERVPAGSARIQWAVAGDVIEGTAGAADIDADAENGASLGFGGIVDAVTPTTIGDITIDADGDGDGKPGRVIVVAAGVDLTIRGGGFAATLEMLYRYENWGPIIRANPELIAAVGAEPKRRFAALYADATYMAMPRRLMVGARAGYGELPFLSMRGPSSVPRGETMFEGGVMASLCRGGRRFVTASYVFYGFGNQYLSEVNGGNEHRLIVETQLNL